MQRMFSDEIGRGLIGARYSHGAAGMVTSFGVDLNAKVSRPEGEKSIQIFYH